MIIIQICEFSPKNRGELELTQNSPSLPQTVEEIVTGIVQKIPKPIDIQEVVTKYPVIYEESMNTVLIQEVIRYIHTHVSHEHTTQEQEILSEHFHQNRNTFFLF